MQAWNGAQNPATFSAVNPRPCSPELQALIELRRAHPYRPEQTIEELRGDDSDPRCTPRPGTQVDVVDANGVRCEWIANGQINDDGVFIYLHGGGYYRGTAANSRRVASYLSAVCRMRVLTVDYRLAPEHPFPAALDDAWTAYHWVRHELRETTRIFVGGISAGGGLTAGLLNVLKRRNEPQPTAALPISPWTDLAQTADSYVTNAATDPVISKLYLDRMSALYLGDTPVDHPEASPVHADLTGLPPMLIQVGRHEVMYGDAIAYADRARQAGVQVKLQEFDHVVHGWHDSEHDVPDIPETIQAMQSIADFTDSFL